MRATPMAALLLVAVTVIACGGGSGVATPVADGLTLRPCTPDDVVERTTLVAPDPGAVPDDAELAAMVAAADNPDLAFMVDERVEDGATRSAALAEAWVQLGGGRVIEAGRSQPGFVDGAYGSIERGEAFQLRFADDAPPLDDLLDDPVVRAVGLVVTTGAVSPDEVLPAAYEAAMDVGLRAVSGYPRDDGTIVIEVIDPVRDAVVAWEAQIDDHRVCLVRAATSVPCDEEVVATARERADTDRPVLRNREQAPPADEDAEEVRRSYLGLTLPAAQAKAVEEDRAVRVTVEDGVELGGNDDLQPGRLSLTLCDDVVVDTRMDLEGVEGIAG